MENGIEENGSWRGQAYALFFVDHLAIKEICPIIRKTRKYVSEYLQSCEEYEAEKELRKKQNTDKRKEYQREWDRANRSPSNDYGMKITGETLQREHELAVMELSAERYY